MRHLGALLLKFVIITLILELVLWSLTTLTFGNILSISITVTILSYLIGDLAILPASNNTVATAADIGLSLITILMFNLIFPGAAISFVDAFLASAVIGIGEWVFHKLMARLVITDQI